MIRLDHCVIAVSDWEAANAFYRDVVGAEVVPGGSGRFAYRFGDAAAQRARAGRGRRHARRPHAVTPGNSDLCFVWDGPIEEAVTHLERHAVAIEDGPATRHGAGGEGTSVYFRDPDGSLLEFIAYLKKH